MKNTLEDLNNLLFAEIENLQDEDNMDPDRLDAVIKRSQAVGRVAEVIVHNAELSLKALEHMNEYGYGMKRNDDLAPLPRMLSSGQ